MKINIGVSNRHAHITKEDYQLLFNKDELTHYKDLKQQGHFAALEKVNVIWGDRVIKDVRLLGPFRNYTQVELAKTDARYLKVDAPLRESGDLDDAAVVIIEGPCGRIERKAAIIATRHIHISKDDLDNLNLNNYNYVDIYLDTEKPTLLKKVSLKETPNGFLELHLDTDDANAALVNEKTLGEIIINEEYHR